MSDQSEVLNLLEWAIEALQARSSASGDWSISMHPNWTLAKQRIAESKERAN